MTARDLAQGVAFTVLFVVFAVLVSVALGGAA